MVAFYPHTSKLDLPRGLAPSFFEGVARGVTLFGGRACTHAPDYSDTGNTQNPSNWVAGAKPSSYVTNSARQGISPIVFLRSEAPHTAEIREGAT
jgi:hypothetical protein